MGSDIENVSDDSEWPMRFGQLGRALRAALDDVAPRIDHIGSTALLGPVAKPIDDIQVSRLIIRTAGFERGGGYSTGIQLRGSVTGLVQRQLTGAARSPGEAQ